MGVKGSTALVSLERGAAFGSVHGHKIEDLSSQLQTLAAEQFKAPAHAALGVSKAESSRAYEADKDEEVDEAGIEPKDIELVMAQAGVSRSKAVMALRSAI
ncbi:hypothetical protein L7F22_007064 [Adiantum nelumboides]|nr:hypothetical protein [Adiantum nelumboides]